MMTPPNPQNLISTTTSIHRRSFHWKFEDDDEFDLSIDRNAITIMFGIAPGPEDIFMFKCKYGDCIDEYRSFRDAVLHNDRFVKIQTWFNGTDKFIEFVTEEHKDLVADGQTELELPYD